MAYRSTGGGIETMKYMIDKESLQEFIDNMNIQAIVETDEETGYTTIETNDYSYLITKERLN